MKWRQTCKFGLLALALSLGGCNFLSGELNLGDETSDQAFDDDGEPDNNVNAANNVVEPGEIDPGRVTLQRLNRFEYNNTVRDLLGITSRPADNFPEDDFGYGFNNNGDVLSLSPLHIESYHRTAEAMIEEALAGGAPASSINRVEAENMNSTVGSANNEFWNLFSNGEVTSVETIPATGTYNIRVRAAQQAAGPEDAQMSVAINGQPVETFTVTATANGPEVYETTTTIDEGGQQISVAFLNDYYDAAAGDDRNLLVDWVEIEGPTDAMTEASPQRDRILTCTPEEAGQQECAEEILSAFGKQAWRRPLEEAEVTRLTEFVDLAISEGDDFETGIKLALRAILVSPNFIFRVETDPDVADATPHQLTDYELASRLSYFIWSSMPDDELMRLADEGQLQDKAVLEAQVERMLDDEKAIALIDQYATQWLYIDAVLNTNPDYEKYPEFSEELKDSMRTETRLFVKELIDTNAPLSELLTANFTYLDQRLAEHYDVAGVTSEEHVRHEWQGEGRRGLLGHGGLLTATSHPNSTSPVLRGKWVLDNILCDEPPPPPPGVENLADDPEISEDMTMRERFEAHSEDPKCATCHRLMDPIGFGMEHFDGVGSWREMDNGKPIDASGELPGEINFNGPTELAQILAESEKLPECATEKMLTYALGRGMKKWDKPQMEAIVTTTGPNHGFRDLIKAVATSDAFRYRRGGELQE